MKLLLKLFASVVINKLRCLALDPSLAAQQDPTSSIIHIYVKLEVALFALSPSSAMLVLAVLVLMGRGGSAQSSIRGNHNRVNMYTVSAAIHESERLERHPGRQRIQRVTSSERVTTLEQMVFEG
ncbi:hypothetical protein UCREL1_6037 [Eutypa lata UCREL1]|uniref:Uncharacterized protein n=1 Tax=Eutypa lata (strain UCR-EL1) TaxID=1287681 RepID=M7TAR1_EUTLA|nr:hypothetical protein UCREL1_6037 [Eutypa lata UCREL1]